MVVFLGTILSGNDPDRIAARRVEDERHVASRDQQLAIVLGEEQNELPPVSELGRDEPPPGPVLNHGRQYSTNPEAVARRDQRQRAAARRQLQHQCNITEAPPNQDIQLGRGGRPLSTNPESVARRIRRTNNPAVRDAENQRRRDHRSNATHQEANAVAQRANSEARRIARLDPEVRDAKNQRARDHRSNVTHQEANAVAQQANTEARRTARTDPAVLEAERNVHRTARTDPAVLEGERDARRAARLNLDVAAAEAQRIANTDARRLRRSDPEYRARETEIRRDRQNYTRLHHPSAVAIGALVSIVEDDYPAHYLGPMSHRCGTCQARFFGVIVPGTNRIAEPEFLNSNYQCCKSGRIVLPPFPALPSPMYDLFLGQDVFGRYFREHIRKFNNAYCFACNVFL